MPPGDGGSICSRSCQSVEQAMEARAANKCCSWSCCHEASLAYSTRHRGRIAAVAGHRGRTTGDCPSGLTAVPFAGSDDRRPLQTAGRPPETGGAGDCPPRLIVVPPGETAKAERPARSAVAAVSVGHGGRNGRNDRPSRLPQNQPQLERQAITGYRSTRHRSGSGPPAGR